MVSYLLYQKIWLSHPPVCDLPGSTHITPYYDARIPTERIYPKIVANFLRHTCMSQFECVNFFSSIRLALTKWPSVLLYVSKPYLNTFLSFFLQLIYVISSPLVSDAVLTVYTVKFISLFWVLYFISCLLLRTVVEIWLERRHRRCINFTQVLGAVHVRNA